MAESICSDNIDTIRVEEDIANMMDAVSIADEDEAKFRCQNYYFSLSTKQLAKIPYLEVLANTKEFMEKPDCNGIISLNHSICDPNLMKAIIKYIKTDRHRYLFTELPECNVIKLFELLDYLCIEKPKCLLVELNKQLKNVTSICDKHGMYFETSDRSRARDACVKLCWIGLDLFGPKEKDKLYNMVVYVMSHPRTFYLRLRRLTLNWYLHHFQITDKQRTILQGWLDRNNEEKTFYCEDQSSSGGSEYEGSPDYEFSD